MESCHTGNMTKRLKRPRDPMQLAKLILDIATGKVKDEPKHKIRKRPTKKAAPKG